MKKFEKRVSELERKLNYLVATLSGVVSYFSVQTPSDVKPKKVGRPRKIKVKI